jgi:hypothetical protein
VRFLDEGYGPTTLSKGIAKRITSLTRANQDGVVFLHVRTSAQF